MIHYIAAFLILLLTACQTTTLQKNNIESRTPTNTQDTYTYVDSAECRSELSTRFNQSKTHLSALTGMSVGPLNIKAKIENLDQKILRPFITDGCSSSPDGIPVSHNPREWVHCCVKHDTRYWTGGTKADKDAADEELKQCITETGHEELAKVYRLFVGQFGGPQTRQNYRWGYGWNYQRPYAPLSQDEHEQIRIVYGYTHLEQASQDLYKNNHELKRVCDTYDPIFWGNKKIEELVFQHLNHNLKEQKTIEYAQLTYFNLDQSELKIELTQCKEPIKYIFNRSEHGHQIKATNLSESCD